ncbi:5-formyltetrahydrofolate cyclo-ligase [Anaerococcus sp. AGMB00486]|uniref:5-formyltetrahydrofolate cyclo-ligase n=2 Tax=Anaerococcus TaxID=165779 RepID=A0ABX2N9G4_9FIRM|nr:MULTISPECIES: 5-formyltetrahydrofolate cyclo-ligase [Anaerococcus]MDY3006394.1 5-formyltetrahydrofolate cyclo-ligase [Anaerococcus porci]MSS78473.1 5-formyltetrahydrofolate cyclo-ligase [Anaerococcus porci]NVF11329.1 5-formyltetrahydrofolate cyclo-ligase [Anaerococcus faecalis]
MKREMRRYFKALRDRISEYERETWNEEIRKKLFNLDKFRNASEIFTYLSKNDEVDTRKIIEKSWKMGKKVYIPKITEDRKMIPVLLESFNDLTYGLYDIETSKNRKTSNKIEISLVPGLSFDKNRHRIGYGGGFYDKFIKDNESFYIGLFYDISESFNLNLDPLDEKLDMIISDKKII